MSFDWQDHDYDYEVEPDPSDYLDYADHFEVEPDPSDYLDYADHFEGEPDPSDYLDQVDGYEDGPDLHDFLENLIDESRTEPGPLELLGCDGAELTEKERLKTELRHEREAKGSAFALCRRLEQETVNLKTQGEADKREIERLKEQIASSSNENTSSYDMSRDPHGVCVIINNIHFEDMADREGAEGDTDRLRETFESLGFTV
ncbi:uncharacterized protein LOC144885074 [Branchiostoma floridae x Branchiostoma japonicum]